MNTTTAITVTLLVKGDFSYLKVHFDTGSLLWQVYAEHGDTLKCIEKEKCKH